MVVLRFLSVAMLLRCMVETEAMHNQLGVDVSQPVSTESFTCLIGKGYDMAIVRAFRSSGQADYNAPQTVRNARAANMLEVDAYMFPCPKCGNAKQQVEDMLSLNLNPDWTWLDIEVHDWFENKTKNQEFFEDLIDASVSTAVGVYTSKNNWATIMGLAYIGGSGFPLWYAHYDSQANFDDFVPFGGWTKPFKKQFAGDQVVCGVGVDLNFGGPSLNDVLV